MTQKRMGGSSVDANVLGVRFFDGTYQITAAVDNSDATQIQGVDVSPTPPSHNGELLIYDSVLNAYVPGDPLVQGLFPEGTATSGINPILVGGTGADGLLHALSVDNSGNLNVDVTFPGTMAVTGTFWQATQPVSIASLPLPSGASTASNQTTELASLASIDSKTPVLVGGSIPVSGTFWQATQPVSGAISFTAPQHVIVDSATLGTVAVSGTFWQATQPVSGTFWQATQPVSGTVAVSSVSGSVAVTGTFWQATQPISGAISFTAPQHVIVDSATLGTVAVSGTFWQATQPVSSTQLPAALDGSGFLKVHEQGTIPVTGTFWQATQPVSGTFWQATQPISGAISFTAPQHVIIDSATLGTVAVSGTFWQATQPVSIASMPSTPVTGTFWQATQPVSGTFFQTTQPVSGTFWQATQPVSGTVAFSNTTIAVTNAGTFAVQAAQSGTWNVGLSAGSNTIGKVDILGNAGATLDATIGAAAAPTNAIATLVVYNSTPPALTTGQSVAQQGNSAGDTFVKPYRRSETAPKATTIASTTTATAVVTAPASGFYADISSLFISVTPAASTALVFTATLSDGTASYIFDMDTGTVAAPAGAPINITFNPPLKATTAATQWTIALNVATVTVHITTVATLNTAS